MIFRTPCRALAPFVSQLWWFAGLDLTHRRERKLPDTRMQILINLQEDRLRWWDGASLADEHSVSGAAVGGMYEQAFAIDTAAQRQVIGAVLCPGAAPALLRVAADEIGSRHVELDAVWGRSAGATLRQQVLESKTPEMMLETFEASLLTHLVGRIDPVIARARGALERGASVDSVARDLGYSTKRLRRSFAAAIGVTPRCYARIARLQRVLAAANSGQRPAWVEVALDCGYYDQAHLISDFRALTGVTPTAYRARNADEQNHIVLDH